MNVLYANKALAAHEAGHAMVAHHFGLKIKSFGLQPIPHCLVSQRGATKEQLGIMLCAGAAGTMLMHGKKMGHQYDYEMAAELGDVAQFTTKALVILMEKWPAFLMFEGALYGEDHPDVLAPNEEGWSEVYDAIQAARPGKFTMWLLNKMAIYQMRYPRLMAHMANLQQKYVGALYRMKDRLTGKVS